MCTVSSITSRPHQAIEQRPSQDKTHHPRNHIARPKIAKGAIDVALRIALGHEQVDEHGDKACADEIESKAGVGFETESAGDDAEEGGGDVPDVGDDLRLETC
jgi:hypothetical protein